MRLFLSPLFWRDARCARNEAHFHMLQALPAPFCGALGSQRSLCSVGSEHRACDIVFVPAILLESCTYPEMGRGLRKSSYVFLFFFPPNKVVLFSVAVT